MTRLFEAVPVLPGTPGLSTWKEYTVISCVRGGPGTSGAYNDQLFPGEPFAFARCESSIFLNKFLSTESNGSNGDTAFPCSGHPGTWGMKYREVPGKSARARLWTPHVSPCATLLGDKLFPTRSLTRLRIPYPPPQRGQD